MTEYFFAAPALRQLSATKSVPYSPSTAFAALSDISSYERATSLIYASSVISKDANGLAKSAKLNVGYPALAMNEEWLCKVKCDRAKRTVEISNPTGAEFRSSFVESYLMKWTISTVANDKAQAEIRLDLQVQFKGPMVDSMFAVLPDVAASIMYRFSALVEAQDKREREQAKKTVPRKKAVSEAVKSSAAPVPVKRVPKKLEVRSGQAAVGGKQRAVGS